MIFMKGGEAPDPNYQNIQDSTEAFIVEYNPDKLSYRDILEEWADLDYPLMEQKTQYRSAVFTLNDEQQGEAESFVKELAAKNADKGRIYCTVEPVTKFYRGEGTCLCVSTSRLLYCNVQLLPTNRR